MRILHAYKVYLPSVYGGIPSVIAMLAALPKGFETRILVACERGIGCNYEFQGVNVEAVSSVGMIEKNAARNMQAVFRPIRTYDAMGIELRGAVRRFWNAQCLLVLSMTGGVAKNFRRRRLEQAAVRLVLEQELANILRDQSIEIGCLPGRIPALYRA